MQPSHHSLEVSRADTIGRGRRRKPRCLMLLQRTRFVADTWLQVLHTISYNDARAVAFSAHHSHKVVEWNRWICSATSTEMLTVGDEKKSLRLV